MATPSLVQHHAAATISLAMAHPADSSSGGSGSSGSTDGGSTISANDFLTLLVTEMQNQDPTADTDPNEYINQLVEVNSLEQLIQINQTLSTAVPASSSGVTSPSSPVQSTHEEVAKAQASLSTLGNTNHISTATTSQSVALSDMPAPITSPITSGNLSVPAEGAAALRVSQVLGGSRARP